jgi:hypothetical protein
MSHCSLETLRIPRGLWADLEQTVIQQDRQFLTEVARTLGLDPKEVLRKCLGTSGTSTAVTCLIGEDTESLCPFYYRSPESYLWTPCCRIRTSKTTPCALHTFAAPGTLLIHKDSPAFTCLPVVEAVSFQEKIYWVLFDEARKQTTMVFNEDGTLSSIRFRWVLWKQKNEHLLMADDLLR